MKTVKVEYDGRRALCQCPSKMNRGHHMAAPWLELVRSAENATGLRYGIVTNWPGKIRSGSPISGLAAITASKLTPNSLPMPLSVSQVPTT